MNKGKLYLIPSQLATDALQLTLTPQVKEVIDVLDFYLAENIRSARRFLSAAKTAKKIEELNFEELNKNTSALELDKLLEPLHKGIDMGVISEAGCPGIADPGALAVAYCHRHNFQVIPLVGPSSILLALMASGVNGQSFTFHGYLPIDKSTRLKKLKTLESDSEKFQRTQIFMETPYRNLQILETIIECCKSNTFLCIAANINSSEEFIKTQTIAQWRKNKPDIHKKPAIFLISRQR